MKQLEAVVLFRVVAGSERNASIKAFVANYEIKVRTRRVPDVENLRAVSATVAVAVANQAATDGVADRLADPVQAVQDAIWQAVYRPLEVK